MVTNFYRTITAAAPIITLPKAKKQIKSDDDVTYEDDLVLSYIDAAQGAVSNFINRVISESNFVMEADKFESKITFERNWENDAILKIEYYAPGETVLTLLPSDQYKLQVSSVVECFDIKFLSMPITDKRDDAVIITVKQGFTASTCPTPLIQAMMLRLSDFNERREDRDQGNNPASNNLARAYRKY
ncbi:head-tail connector protein [Flavobacterium sp. FlaQc-28]|uniref:head-tail connector protein n=1 Tax=Flavobacterium sp. FlaQc-28 TaxID=3374178 RepID=UPI00375745FF